MSKALGVMAAVGVLALAGGVGSAGASGSASKACPASFTETRSASELSIQGGTCSTAQAVATRVTAVAPSGCIKRLDRKGRIALKRPCVQLGYTCSAVVKNGHKTLRV